MKNQEICSFYVSDFHLLTIILPYIDEKINEGKEPTIISQKNLFPEVKKYFKCVKKFDFNKEKILNLSWDKKAKEIGKELIVIGDKDFIEKEKSKLYSENVNILNCYEINDIKKIDDIAKEYSIYLNTKGIKQKESKNMTFQLVK